jgi:septum formation protein
MNSPSTAEPPPLVLASSSPFRRELLSRLGMEFSSVSPDVDESGMVNETPEALVLRLAERKARAVAEMHPDALIIGSDQVATIDGRILGKPGSHERAVEPYHVQFRDLTREEVENYLHKEQPYNCAGSFKSEGLGICLFQRMEGDDPSSLIGLPLIRLVDMLRNEGVDILLS